MTRYPAATSGSTIGSQARRSATPACRSRTGGPAPSSTTWSLPPGTSTVCVVIGRGYAGARADGPHVARRRPPSGLAGDGLEIDGAHLAGVTGFGPHERRRDDARGQLLDDCGF